MYFTIKSAVISCFSSHHKLDLKELSILILQLCDEEIAATFSKLLQQLIYFPVKNLHVTLKPKVPAIESCLSLSTRMKMPYLDSCNLISEHPLRFALMKQKDWLPWIFWYKTWFPIILVVLLWTLSSFQHPAWSVDLKTEHDTTVTPSNLTANVLSIPPSQIQGALSCLGSSIRLGTKSLLNHYCDTQLYSSSNFTKISCYCQGIHSLLFKLCL